MNGIFEPRKLKLPKTKFVIESENGLTKLSIFWTVFGMSGKFLDCQKNLKIV